MYHGPPNDFDRPRPPSNPVAAIIVSSLCSVIHIPGHLFRDVILFEFHLCCNIVIRYRTKVWSLAYSARFVFHAVVCARKMQPRPVV